MTQPEFERIETMSEIGREYMLHTMEHFGTRLLDHEKKVIIEMIESLVRSERLKAGVESVEIFKNMV